MDYAQENHDDKGYWQASDGQWYPPEQHPSNIERAALAAAKAAKKADKKAAKVQQAEDEEVQRAYDQFIADKEAAERGRQAADKKGPTKATYKVILGLFALVLLMTLVVGVLDLEGFQERAEAEKAAAQVIEDKENAEKKAAEEEKKAAEEKAEEEKKAAEEEEKAAQEKAEDKKKAEEKKAKDKKKAEEKAAEERKKAEEKAAEEKKKAAEEIEKNKAPAKFTAEITSYDITSPFDVFAVAKITNIGEKTGIADCGINANSPIGEGFEVESDIELDAGESMTLRKSIIIPNDSALYMNHISAWCEMR